MPWDDRAVGAPGGGPAPQNNQPSGAKAPDGSTPARAHQGHEEEEKVRTELQDLVSGLERERDEYLELARRSKADFENYRKRVSREASEAEARGRAALARDLLSVLDNLERALAAAQPRDDDSAANHIAEGVRLVYEELSGVLGNAGVESFEPTGERFDPDHHEAIMSKPGNEGEVLEVVQKGYRLNGQVLRPARVIVGSADRNPPSAGEPADG
jgi:molecular chaperone GrpE